MRRRQAFVALHQPAHQAPGHDSPDRGLVSRPAGLRSARFAPSLLQRRGIFEHALLRYLRSPHTNGCRTVGVVAAPPGRIDISNPELVQPSGIGPNHAGDRPGRGRQERLRGREIAGRLPCLLRGRPPA